MSATPEILNILAVDDEIASIRELEQSLGDAHINLHFADTPNAITRIVDESPIDLALINIHEGTTGLVDPVTKQLRALNPPPGLIALVSAEPQAAAHAAQAGVEGCARLDDERTVRRLLTNRFRQIRESRSQSETLHQVSDLHQRYNLLLESSSEAIAYLHEGLHVYANPSYLEQFGYLNIEDLEGYSVLDLLKPSGDGTDLKHFLKSLAKGVIPDDPVAVNAVRADGSTFNALVEFAPARYEGEACIQAMVREQFEQADNAELQEELEKLRSHDLLTGLMNRQAFVQQLEQEYADDNQHGDLAVLLLSLDDQEGLQLAVGTSATDQLVKQTAALFADATEDDHLPTRLSDQVFAIRTWLDDREQAAQLAKQLVDAFSGSILEIQGKTPTVTASVGVAVGGKSMFTVDETLAHADQARVEAMRSGGNSYLRYRPSTDRGDASSGEQWAERLRHAMDNNEFRLVQLPITDMEDDEFLMVELESRLRSEENEEIILPSVFRPAAAECGLAAELDRQFIDHMLKLMQDGSAIDGPAPSAWLLPLSAASLSDNAVIDHLQSAVDGDTLDGRKLVIGFHEPEIRDQLKDVQKFISRFGLRGVRFALLDVELGSRVELTMKNLETSYIKLDPKILASLGKDKKVRDVLKQLVDEAGENNTHVIAPSVENTSDLATLWQVGVTLVQDQFASED